MEKGPVLSRFCDQVVSVRMFQRERRTRVGISRFSSSFLSQETAIKAVTARQMIFSIVFVSVAACNQVFAQGPPEIAEAIANANTNYQLAVSDRDDAIFGQAWMEGEATTAAAECIDVSLTQADAYSLYAAWVVYASPGDIQVADDLIADGVGLLFAGDGYTNQGYARRLLAEAHLNAGNENFDAAVASLAVAYMAYDSWFNDIPGPFTPTAQNVIDCFDYAAGLFFNAGSEYWDAYEDYYDTPVANASAKYALAKAAYEGANAKFHLAIAFMMSH